MSGRDEIQRGVSRSQAADIEDPASRPPDTSTFPGNQVTVAHHITARAARQLAHRPGRHGQLAWAGDASVPHVFLRDARRRLRRLTLIIQMPIRPISTTME
jgi:hypothetical protein